MEKHSAAERSYSVVLGTGEHLKRDTIPDNAPPKPARTPSLIRREQSPSQVEVPPAENGQYLAPPGAVPDNMPVAEADGREDGKTSADSDALKSGSYDKQVAAHGTKSESPNSVMKSESYDKLLAVSNDDSTVSNGGGGQDMKVGTLSSPSPAEMSSDTVTDVPETSRKSPTHSTNLSSPTKLEGESNAKLSQDAPPESVGSGSKQDSVTKSKKKEGKKSKAKSASKEQGSVGDQTPKDAKNSRVKDMQASNSAKTAEESRATHKPGPKTKTHMETETKLTREEESVPHKEKTVVKAVEMAVVSDKPSTQVTGEEDRKAVASEGTQTPDLERRAVTNEASQTTGKLKKPKLVDQASQTMVEEVVPRVATVDQGVQTEPVASADATKAINKEESNREPSKPTSEITVMET